METSTFWGWVGLVLAAIIFGIFMVITVETAVNKAFAHQTLNITVQNEVTVNVPKESIKVQLERVVEQTIQKIFPTTVINQTQVVYQPIARQQSVGGASGIPSVCRVSGSACTNRSRDLGCVCTT